MTYPAPTAPQRDVPSFCPAKAAIAATFTHYPFLAQLVEPQTTVEVTEQGWIVTVWLCDSLFNRVAVGANGQTQLLPLEQRV